MAQAATELLDHDGNALPPRLVGGKFNPKHIQAKYAVLTDLMHNAVVGSAKLPAGFNGAQYRDLLSDECKVNGLDPKHVLDTRTDAQIIADVMEKAANAPETLLEAADHELDLLEKEFRNAVEGVDSLVRERILEGKKASGTDNLSNTEVKEAERRKRAGKQWLNRVVRVKRLREWIRTTRVPKGESLARHTAFQASKPLFFMLYVNRSNMTQQLRPGSDSKVYLIGACHCKMAMDIYEAREGLYYGPAGVEYKYYKCKGVMLLIHPGAGKTDLVMAYTMLECSLRPNTQGTWLHAKHDKACDHLKHIKDVFKLTIAPGRRRNALYPGLELADRDDNQSTMRLNVEGIKSPTLQAAGVTSAGLSGNTNFQVWDDVIPPQDRDQPTDRERRFARLNQTWLTRQRGDDGFCIFSGYPFHNDDALSKFRRRAMDEQGVNRRRSFLVSQQPAGGPNTTPQFKSVCPELYPADELRSRFDMMNRDINLWASNYMLNPIADEARLIKKLRYYDPAEAKHDQEPSEHDLFMGLAQTHLTIDPTATNKETSDKAAILKCALGQTRVRRGEYFEQETRLRVLGGVRVHLNQIEMGEQIVALAMGQNIDEVHLEIRSSNGTATKDYLEYKYKYTVTTHDPVQLSKGIRLKWVAALLDDSQGGAKVELPGQWEEHNGERVLVCRDDMRWLAKQLLDFGVETEDDGVDALTQLVRHFMQSGQLLAGSGAASVAVQKAVVELGDPRMRKIVKGMFGNNNGGRTAAQEDAAWMARRWR